MHKWRDLQFKADSERQIFEKLFSWSFCLKSAGRTSHTYIIGHYNPPVKIIDTYVVCVFILYISSETYSLKSAPNNRFFEKLFLAILFTSQSFCRRNNFCILFWCLAWGWNPGFTSHKPTRLQRLYSQSISSYRSRRSLVGSVLAY